MNSLLLIVFSALWGSIVSHVIASSESDNSTLKLVHVLFRHGDRNPAEDELIKGSPYEAESYYPEGYGELINAGKLTEYKMGQELRNRYNNFLTDTWNIDYLDARSTNFNRTKMSLLLMLASLYPPQGNQTWSDLPWLPIPYNYLDCSADKETQTYFACAPRWDEILNDIITSPSISNYLLRYQDLFSIISNQTGESVGIQQASKYYFGFVTQSEVGYPLEEWTKSIYPQPITSAAVDIYYLATNTTSIRRIMPGYLLRKILSDTKQKIDGTLSPSRRKMFIYSAHEMNVATMLLALNAFKITETPPYGSHVLFEVHEIDRVWGIKLFYQDYKKDNPHPIKLPECGYFCPFEIFYNLVEKLLPKDDMDCYGS